MRNTKKTSSRPVQVTAPLNVPPTKQATKNKLATAPLTVKPKAATYKPLTDKQRNARIKQLEKEMAKTKAKLQANKLAEDTAKNKKYFIEGLPKEAIIYSHSGAVLLNIKEEQAYDLFNQLSNMFHPEVFSLKDEKKTIFEILYLAVQNSKDKDWAGEYVRVCKEWLSTLQILYTIHNDTQLANS